MRLLHALILGIVQGITEFFPISSSAHLALARKWLGIETLSPQFDLACHLGTLIALIIYFRYDIFALFNSERRKLPLFFLALLPLIPAYFLLRPLAHYLTATSSAGYFLVVSAAMLYLGQRVRIKRERHSLFKDALIIGTMQSAALLPGLSRSASTISAAQVLGWSQKEAVRFSFLLSIPTIMGGNLIEAVRGFQPPSTASFTACFTGFFVALVVGTCVIRFAMRWLENGSFTPFAIYCLIMGAMAAL